MTVPLLNASAGALPVWWQIVADLLTIVGTLVIALLAIWGGWFRQHLASPQLQLVAQNLRGTATTTNQGTRGIYYHLLVRNSRKWATARNCHVMLVGLKKKGPDGQFHPVHLSVPLQFIWAPAGFTPIRPTVTEEQVLDFIAVMESGEPKACIPQLYVTTNDFEGYIYPNTSYRYYLQIRADDFVSHGPTVVEVSWDGEWDENLDEMEQHLRISVAS